ncbi:MAG: tetratricopeptide repeat protein [Parvibaculum sp.]
MNRPVRLAAMLAAGFSTLVLVIAVPAAAQDFVQGWDAYDRGDYETVLANFRPLAEQGGIAPQYYLGLMYARGHGVEQDHVQAVHWFRRAAEQGNPDAQYELAIAINTGLGVERDLELSYQWLCTAALNGHEEADELAWDMNVECVEE